MNKNILLKRIIKTKKFKIISSVLIILILILLGTKMYINPYNNTISWDKMKKSLTFDTSITKAQALDDLEYMIDKVNDRHYSAIDKLPNSVSNQYKKEIENLPEKITVLDLWKASSRILKRLDDAHSQIGYMTDDNKQIDIDLKFSNNTLICTGGIHKGQIIDKINGIKVSDIYEKFLDEFSYENIYYAEYKFPKYLKVQGRLNWMGVKCLDKVEFSFIDNDNYQTELFYFKDIEEEKGQEFVRYNIDKEHNIGIFTLDSCNYNDLYKSKLKEFFKEVDANNIKSIAVDLRKNGGGNSQVSNEFLKYIPVDSFKGFGCNIRYKSFAIKNKSRIEKNEKYNDLIFNGKIFILTSKATFSSATYFAVLLKDNDLCQVIGEPSGNRPSAYGDVLSFQMPHSNLSFSLTYKKFSRPKVSRDKEDALMPDYIVDEENALEKLYEINK